MVKPSKLLPLLLLLAGCSLFDGTPRRWLQIDAGAYDPGDQMTVTLLNQSVRAFNVHPDLCGTQIEYEASGQIAQLDEVCTAIAHLLGPGDVLTAHRTIPDTLKSGRYRLTYDLDAGSTARSRYFSVR